MKFRQRQRSAISNVQATLARASGSSYVSSGYKALVGPLSTVLSPAKQLAELVNQAIHRKPPDTADDTGSRDVGIATVGATFEKRARLWPGDGELTPTIVAPGGPTVSAALPPSGRKVTEQNGVLNVGGHDARSRDVPLDLGIGRDAVAGGSLASGLLPSDGDLVPESITSPEAPCPPLPAPQGGRWYGKSISFAASGEGSFHYLSPDLADNCET